MTALDNWQRPIHFPGVVAKAPGTWLIVAEIFIFRTDIVSGCCSTGLETESP